MDAPRSLHADAFNHDEDAPGYDADVADESNPVRDGYAATLDWVAAAAAVGPGDVAVDLGTGSGNLAVLVDPAAELVGVDVSARMLELAASKLAGRPRVRLVHEDVLAFVAGLDPASVDAVVSTYALHHLVDDEKGQLARLVFRALRPGGRFAVGDLGFGTRSDAATVAAEHGAMVQDLLDEEFAWWVDEAVDTWRAAGFVDVVAVRLGVLSWGLAATRPRDVGVDVDVSTSLNS